MKTLVLFLFLTTVQSLSFAQTKLQGEADISHWPGSHYTLLNWEVYYKFVVTDGKLMVDFSNPKITVSPNSNYRDSDGTIYTKTDFGIGSWPNQYERVANMLVNVTVYYADKTYTPVGRCNSSPPCEAGYVDHVNKLKNFDISLARIGPVIEWSNNVGASAEVMKLIENKKYPKSNNTANTSTSTGTTQPTSVNSAPNTPSSSSSSSSSSSNTQVYTDVINSTFELAGSIAADRHAKKQAENQMWDEYYRKSAEDAHAHLKLVVEKNLDKALRGDMDTRFFMICKLWRGYGKGYGKYGIAKNNDELMLEKVWYQWLHEAYLISNPEAFWIKASLRIGDVGTNGQYEDLTEAQSLALTELAAELGNVDAMLRLAVSYSLKRKLYGLDDPAKAYFWFVKAYEKGHPLAAYYIGMILRYSNTYPPQWQQGSVSFKGIIAKDDKLALEFFKASILMSKTYEKSNYELAFGLSPLGGLCPNYFDDACEELAMMYSKGIGCEKNKELAAHYEGLKE